MPLTNKRAIIVKGRRLVAPQQERNLLACLHGNNLGFAVPYETLCAALGYGRPTRKKKHALQQHVVSLKRLLDSYGVPCTITVAHNVGYALCPVRKAKK